MHVQSLLYRRADLAESALLELAEVLDSAPDPLPLLTAAGSSKANLHGMLQLDHSVKADKLERTGAVLTEVENTCMLTSVNISFYMLQSNFDLRYSKDDILCCTSC